MPEFKDLTGMRFGKWTVIKRSESTCGKSGKPHTMWLCQCDCGSSPRPVYSSSLLSGRSTSCGCSQKETAANFCRAYFSSHNESKTRLYRIWAGMKKRCENPNASNYPNYGGRGITVCDDWHSYSKFKSWAIAAGYSDDLTLDRIDVNENYEPSNCRWVNNVTQSNNRRSNKYYYVGGKQLTLAELSREYGFNYKQAHKKLKSGACTIEEIIKPYQLL